MKTGYSLWKISGFFTEIMFRLPAVRQAEEHSRNGGRVFMYYWEKRSHLPYLRACHAVELSYVFGNIQDTIYTGKPAIRRFPARCRTSGCVLRRRGIRDQKIVSGLRITFRTAGR